MRMGNDSKECGALSLLAYVDERKFYEGEMFFFMGDLIQMVEARNVAAKLGKKIGTNGGIPFVMSREDFDEVTQYIISNRINGWWHYVSHEEYLKMK